MTSLVDESKLTLIKTCVSEFPIITRLKFYHQINLHKKLNINLNASLVIYLSGTNLLCTRKPKSSEAGYFYHRRKNLN